MSNFISELNRIMRWLQSNSSEYAMSFLPGLSEAEIDEVEERIHWKLPEDLRNLYKWHNGTNKENIHICIPFGFHFSPLEQISASYQDEYGGKEEDYFILEDGRYIFPFSEIECNHLAVIIQENNSEYYGQVVVHYGDGGGEYIIFENVAAMIYTLAEAYDSGIFFLDDDGMIDCNSTQLISIMEKYTPSTLTEKLLIHIT